MVDQTKQRWLDTTISVQKVVTGVMTALTGIAIWAATWAYGIDKQVAKNTADNIEQDRHFDRVELSIQQQRNDTNQQLRDISSDVKDIRNFIMNNSAAARPDVQRWSK